MLSRFTRRLVSPFLSASNAQSAPAASRIKPAIAQTKRNLNIHEYLSLELMESYDIPTARGKVATTPDEAVQVHKSIGADKDVVIKAQILAGGRGKGKFENLLGGVHVITGGVEETRDLASRMLGQVLVTKQTGKDGKRVDKVVVVEREYNRREAYLALLLDRARGCVAIVSSAKGGMDIEAVAAAQPSEIHTEFVKPEQGLSDENIQNTLKKINFSKDLYPDGEKMLRNMYKLFTDKDCTQIEINPLAETSTGKLLCLDAKLNFDDNASFRQQDLFELRDVNQEDPREVQAKSDGYEYINLDGNIGCMVNGAGLAMATMDAVKLEGGEPANFCDLGGGADAERVAKAFQVMYDDPEVEAMLVNIFGGIMRCDIIALGLIMAVGRVQGPQKPVVIRLEGTKLEEAKKLVEESGLRMIFAKDLQEAARKAVRLVEIQAMAREAGVRVNFNLPL